MAEWDPQRYLTFADERGRPFVDLDEPSHEIRRQLQDEEPYASYTRGLERPGSGDPQDYWRVFADLGWDAEAWETTYLHVLSGSDPVFSWISGTSARPVLQALPDDVREQFSAELKRRLADAYRPTEHGVLMPFRRVFVVARRPKSSTA